MTFSIISAKKKTILYSLLLSVLIITSCETKKVKIKGNFPALTGQTVYLDEMIVNQAKVLDSASVSNGKFHFTIKTTTQSFYQVRTQKGMAINLLVKPGEKIYISSAGATWSNYNIEGSEGSELILLINKRLQQTKKALDSLERVYNSYLNNKELNADKIDFVAKEYEETLNIQKRYIKAFLLKNSTSLVSIVALYQQISPDNYVLNSVKDLQFFKIITDSLTKYHPKSKYVKSLQINTNNMLAEYQSNKFKSLLSSKESSMPQISLPNINGDIKELKTIKEKYVLLAFYSVQDKESLMNNLELKEVYQKYGGKQFEIFQVSLDGNKKLWENYVLGASLPWISVIDTTAQNSYFAKIYNVQTLPGNYLITLDGLVLGKNLTGKALKTKLAELLK